MTDRPDDEAPQRGAPEGPQRERSYLVASVRAVFSDPSWWWRSVVLALLAPIPIVGWLAISGYVLTWMRRTVIGADDRLPAFDPAKEHISNAFRAVVVGLTWALLGLVAIVVPLIALVALVLTGLPPDASGPPLPVSIALGTIALVFAVAYIALMVLSEVGVLRATLYRRTNAGWEARRIWQLISCDFGRFLRAYGVTLLVSLPGLAAAILGQELLGEAPELPVALAWDLLGGLLAVPAILVGYRALGLWLREVGPRPSLVMVPQDAAPVAAVSDDPFSDAAQPGDQPPTSDRAQ